jgi:hypothetical protein
MARLLLQEGKIKLNSREHTMIRRVADNGVSLLNAADREHFDQVIVPLMEAVRRAG